VCCSVLQCVAVCCSVMQWVAVRSRGWQCVVAVGGSVLGGVLQRVVICYSGLYVALGCSVSQYSAVCCSELQWVAVSCSVLQ